MTTLTTKDLERSRSLRPVALRPAGLLALGLALLLGLGAMVQAQDKSQGNESHPAPVFDDDPFAGTWVGIVREENGLHLKRLAQQLKRNAEKGLKEERQKIEQREVVTEADRANRERALQDQAQLEGFAGSVIDIAEQFAVAADPLIRLGVPVELKIARKNYQYTVTFERVLGMELEVEDRQEIPAERVGPRTLRIASGELEEFPDILLFSPRDGSIREDDGLAYELKSDDGSGTLNFLFRWNLKRRE